jgi:hypothetical protein
MYKLFTATVFMILATVAFSHDLREEYRREINKEFKVSADAFLSITNKYGNIKIVEGNDSKIVFRIEITGKASKTSVAEEYAKGVNIAFVASGNKVSATTELPNMDCSNCGIMVNYFVTAPRNTTLNIDLKYGKLVLENAVKPLKATVKYGNISAENIADANIDLDYGTVSVATARNLNVAMKYSTLTANNVEKMNLDCKYSKIKISEIGTLTCDSKYDQFSLGSVVDFTLSTGYSGITIDRLGNSFIANDLKYGKLNISNVDVNFSKIAVDAHYTNVNVGLTAEHRFNATLYAENGKINSGNISFNNVRLSEKQAIAGIAGSDSNPRADVKITTRYGNIVFR